MPLGLDDDPAPGAPTLACAAEPQAFGISLRLADGREVISGRSSGDAPTSQPHPAAARRRRYRSLLCSRRWWAWPLPPQGPLEFACRWPMYAITETRTSIDAQLILDAAQRSIKLWPEHEG